MKNLLFVLLINLLPVFCNHLSAGWVITIRQTNSEGLILYETLTIEGNLVKSSGLKGTFIFDLNSGVFVLVAEKERVYWQGDINDFRIQLNEAMQNIVDTFITSLPQEQRETYSPVFEGMKEMFRDVNLEHLDTLAVEIGKTGEKLDVAGYSSEKYLVRVSGSEMEQIWIAPSLKVSNDFNGKKLAESINKISPLIMGEIPYDRTDAYTRIWDKGFRMKSLDVGGNGTEVIKVVEQQIDKSEFIAPDGFQKISVEEIIRKQILQGESEFDTPDEEIKN